MLAPLSQPSQSRTPGPTLVARPHPRHSPLALWHLLSLDAPTVAALWTFFVARCAGIGLRWTQLAAMFVAVWMIYAADRLLDARLLDAPPLDTRLHPNSGPPPDLEARHRFHHAHRGRFLAVIVLAALALVFLLQRIQTSALHLYALLATLLAAWLLLIHARPAPSNASHRLPKELAVGIFFPAAIFIPTVARAPWLRPALLPAAALFAAVCTLNCLFLYAWEHPSPRLKAHWTTRWATSHLSQLAALILFISSLIAASVPLSQALSQSAHPLLSAIPAPLLYLSRWPALACALSAALLLLLHLLRRRFSAVHLRASADLVLLTPLLFLPFLRP